jgi:hypothetical protein
MTFVKQKKELFVKRIKTILVAQLALLVLLLCISAPAWANLAANTQIINSADLSYYDGAKTQHATASVTVTVSLVSGAPTIVAGLPQTTSYNGCTTTLTDSFTITAGSNGPDTYNLSAAVVPSGSSNSTGSGAVPTVATVLLGASITIVGSDSSHIYVPYDGSTTGNTVNGIAVGATVVINSQERTVTAINEYPPNPPTITIGYAIITLNTGLTSYVPGAGVLVAERKTVTTTVTSGCITLSGTDVTVSDTLTATSGSGSGPAFTSGSVLNTYTSGIATLAKYVRNVTTSVAGTGTPYVYGGNSYYLAGVTAKAVPTPDTLEYLLIATNTSATGSVTQAVITDAVPTGYVTFKTGMYTGGKDITYIDETATAHYLTAAGADDAGVYAAPNLTVNVGGATPAIPPLPGGTIPPTKTVVVLYQVTINP